MVLEHVPQQARLLEIPRAVFEADRLGRRDLDVVDVPAVPQGLEDRVGEPEHQDVLHGLLAQVVVDAVDLVLAEHAADFTAERRGAGQVAAEGLLDHHAPPGFAALALAEQTGRAQAPDHRAVERRRHGQVEDGAALRPEFGGRSGEPLG